MVKKILLGVVVVVVVLLSAGTGVGTRTVVFFSVVVF